MKKNFIPIILTAALVSSIYCGNVYAGGYTGYDDYSPPYSSNNEYKPEIDRYYEINSDANFFEFIRFSHSNDSSMLYQDGETWYITAADPDAYRIRCN